MQPSDHLKAAQQEAKTLAQGNLIPQVKQVIVRNWCANMLAFLKGNQNGR